MTSVQAALDAAETEADRKAVFRVMGQSMLAEIEALGRDSEGHRPSEVRITRREGK